MNGRGSKQRYIGCPHSLYDHPAFHTLSYMATCLWVDMLRQYNGFNNGNIAATLSTLDKRKWNSSSLHRALRELVNHGLLEKTRQGGIASMSRISSLYAFTHLPNNPNEKLGLRGAAPTQAYKDFVPPDRPKRRPRGIPANRRNRKVLRLELRTAKYGT